MLQRLREGSVLTDGEIDDLARNELRKAYDDLAESFHKNDDWREALNERLAELRDDLDSRAFLQIDIFSDDGKQVPIPLRQDAEAMVARMGAEPTEDSIRALCRVLAKSRIAAIESFLAGVEPPLPERPRQVAQRRRQGSGKAFKEVADRYFADRTRDPAARWSGQTEKQYRATCRLFGDFVGATRIDGITREMAAEFLETIGRLHRDYARSSRAKALTLDELLEKYPAGEGTGLSNVTLNRHAGALHGLFKWARKRGLFDGENPFAEQSRPSGRNHYVPFTIDELNKLFSHPLLTDATHAERTNPSRHSAQTALMWVPLIALFSGMREDEICGLRTADVAKEDGVLAFNVVPHEGRRVKTAASARRVPVHSELIACGFAEYLQHVQQDEYLFPGLKPGGPDGKRSHYLTKRFTEYRRRVGVDRRQVVFQSFRKNVVEALERARVHQSEVAQVVGHDRGFTFSVYSPLGLDPVGLRDIVEKIAYLGLELPVKPGK